MAKFPYFHFRESKIGILKKINTGNGNPRFSWFFLFLGNQEIDIWILGKIGNLLRGRKKKENNLDFRIFWYLELRFRFGNKWSRAAHFEGQFFKFRSLGRKIIHLYVKRCLIFFLGQKTFFGPGPTVRSF